MIYEAHAWRLVVPRMAFWATAASIMMDVLAVSETYLPWYLDELLRACELREGRKIVLQKR